MVDRNAERLAEQLMTWPAADRVRLAALLLASMESSDSAVEQAWDDEVARRTEALDSGRVTGVPAADVFAELDRRLGR